MAIAILGKKVGMTQVFDEDGNRVPVTVIEAGPCPVLQVKTAEGRDGYDAVVLGFEPVKEKSLTKPVLGRFRKWEAAPTRHVREVRITPDEAAMYPPPGQALQADIFQPGEKVDVTGHSRGRGFQGVMKRHGMHGFPDSHGTHEYFRHPGSIGNRTWPGRVIKGKRLPGHHGDERNTILNLRVVAVMPERNLLMVKGAVPGAPGTLLTVRKAIKVPARKAAR